MQKHPSLTHLFYKAPLGDPYKEDMEAGLAALGALVQLSVISRTTDQPSAPAEGDRYVNNGNWSVGTVGDVMLFIDGDWRAYTPTAGWWAFVQDAGTRHQYKSGAWSEFSTDPNITGKTQVVAAGVDEVLVADTSNAGALRKVTAQAIADLGGGGAEFWSEVLHTTAPNDTKYTLQWKATGESTDISVALTPKGNGALQAQVADATAAGGDVRGIKAVDWQSTRAFAVQVAGGSHSVVAGGRENRNDGAYASILGGQNNTVGGNHGAIGGGQDHNISSLASYAAIAGGRGNNAGRDYTFVGGGRDNEAQSVGSSVLGGEGNVAEFLSNYGAILGGRDARIRGIPGQAAYGGTMFAAPGDAQISTATARVETTDELATPLYIQGFDNLDFEIPDNTTWDAEIRIVAREAAGANHAIFNRRLVIKKDADAASTAIIGSVQTPDADIGSNAGAPPAGWSVAISADTTNGALLIEVTGTATETIRWMAKVDLVEVGHP